MSQDIIARAMAASAKNGNLSTITTSDGKNSLIFNDIENNESNIPYASIMGQNNKAVIRGRRITQTEDYHQSVLRLTIDNIADISIGDNVNFFWRRNGKLYKLRDTVGSINITDSWVGFDNTGEMYAQSYAITPSSTSTDISAGCWLIIVKDSEEGTILTFEYPEDGWNTHLSGNNNVAGLGANAMGDSTRALGILSVTEGYDTEATGERAHAKGYKSKASGHESSAEGNACKSIGYAAHAENDQTYAYGRGSHTQGYRTHAFGDFSSAEGYETESYGQAQHVQGKYNIKDTQGNYAHIVGNGDSNNRSNAHTIDWDGNGWFAGKILIGQNNKELGTKEYSDYILSSLKKLASTINGCVGQATAVDIAGVTLTADTPYLLDSTSEGGIKNCIASATAEVEGYKLLATFDVFASTLVFNRGFSFGTETNMVEAGAAWNTMYPMFYNASDNVWYGLKANGNLIIDTNGYNNFFYYGWTSEIKDRNLCAIYVDGDLTITGDGYLQLTSTPACNTTGDSNIYTSYGIRATKNINLNSGTVYIYEAIHSTTIAGAGNTTFIYAGNNINLNGSLLKFRSSSTIDSKIIPINTINGSFTYNADNYTINRPNHYVTSLYDWAPGARGFTYNKEAVSSTINITYQPII